MVDNLVWFMLWNFITVFGIKITNISHPLHIDLTDNYLEMSQKCIHHKKAEYKQSEYFAIESAPLMIQTISSQGGCCSDILSGLLLSISPFFYFSQNFCTTLNIWSRLCLSIDSLG